MCNTTPIRRGSDEAKPATRSGEVTKMCLDERVTSSISVGTSTATVRRSEESTTSLGLYNGSHEPLYGP